MEESEALFMDCEAGKDFPRTGAKKLLIYIHPQSGSPGVRIGRDTFIELPYRNFIAVRRVRNKCKATFSKCRMHGYPNLTCDYTPMPPNRLRAGDMTYLETENKVARFLFIADVRSHKSAGRNPASTLRASNATESLRMVPDTFAAQKQYGPVHHPGGGARYYCARYVKPFNKYDVMISLTAYGDSRENAMAGRVNGTLKTERPNMKTTATPAETSDSRSKIIDLYNNQRPHQSIDYLTPQEVHATGIGTGKNGKINVQKHKRVFGRVRHKTPEITVKKDCMTTILHSCNFVKVKSIPDRLLPGRACFRFDLTRRRYDC
jgi:transposase InsO family protein